MKRQLIWGAALLAAGAFGYSGLALADHEDPPVEGTTCTTACDLNNNWSFGEPVPTGDPVPKQYQEVIVEGGTVPGPTTNVAIEKSSGKASAKNQSNFGSTTTTTDTVQTIEYTETPVEMDHLNPEDKVNNNADPKGPSEGVSTEIQSNEITGGEETTTLDGHIKPDVPPGPPAN